MSKTSHWIKSCYFSQRPLTTFCVGARLNRAFILVESKILDPTSLHFGSRFKIGTNEVVFVCKYRFLIDFLQSLFNKILLL
jgi:hypothetical protein